MLSFKKKKDKGKYSDMFRFEEAWVINGYMSVFYSMCFALQTLCGKAFSR